MAPNPNPRGDPDRLEELLKWAGEDLDERGSYRTDTYHHLVELKLRRNADTGDQEVVRGIQGAPVVGVLLGDHDGSRVFGIEGRAIVGVVLGEKAWQPTAAFVATDGMVSEVYQATYGAGPIHVDPSDDDLYEPGRFECGNCDFTMGVSVIVHGMDGIERPGVLPREMLENPPSCPRCHELMHRATWRKKAEFYQRCLENAQENIASLSAELKGWREDASANNALAKKLNAEIDKAEERVGRMRSDYERACQTIAAMHKATTGLTRGPIRGVVEDVEDLADLVDGLAEYISAGQVPLHTGAYLLHEYQRLRGPHMAAAREGSRRALARGRGLIPEEPLK